MTQTPRQLGYRWPAEWEPHAATWLSWPHKQESWPGRFETIPDIFTRMVASLAEGEEVRINVRDAAMEADVRARLRGRAVPEARVRFFRVPTDDAWCRDHGPTFVTRAGDARDRLALVDWEYNAWGGKYPPWDLDNAVPERIAAELGVPRFAPGIVLEGGAIDGNGHGALLTTEACLLHPNRNPRIDRGGIERILYDYLAVDRVHWLGEGIAGDDTDGHVDDIARFVAPDTIVTAVEEDPADDNYRPLQDNLARLRALRDRAGKAYRIVTLPMPAAGFIEGQRLPMSYANFYIANAVVLVPTYDPARDPIALETLARLIPDRRIVAIDCRELVWGLGAFHCVTQQQPR